MSYVSLLHKIGSTTPPCEGDAEHSRCEHYDQCSQDDSIACQDFYHYVHHGTIRYKSRDPSVRIMRLLRYEDETRRQK